MFFQATIKITLKSSVLLSAAILCHFVAKAQTEYLVKVNPATGAYIKIDSIPGVMYIYGDNTSIFDSKHQVYIFEGAKDGVDTAIFLYSIDAGSGKVISKAPFSMPNNTITLQAFVYAGSLNTMYGIYGDGNNNEYLATVDVPSGSYSIIKQVAGITAVYDMFFDSTLQQLEISGVDISGSQMLYAVDTKTAIVLAKMPVANLSDVQYNNKSQKFYGLLSNAGNGFSLVSFDIAAASTDFISNLPAEIEGIYDGNTTFDDIHNRYILNASDTNAVSFLYSIDASSCSEIYKIPVPTTDNVILDNIIQYRFDNVSGNLYALHWEAHTQPNTDSGSTTQTKPFFVWPNPLTGSGKIVLDSVYNAATFMLYDARGRLVQVATAGNASVINISKGYLANAIYFYKIFCDNKLKASGKLLVK